ncbi:probable jasmonic acid carboxyl methyltransferase 1 [Macadamia integrifolia]|uniref:probable jasmonic acid carboxyl methyltransferase 1 n=1 Tax=Macadamia integrifolia TaxID=60698 RepID=UPI001C4F7982|nr:probable jasmonic acid carboxyl methyltransferase 1 [Macadamia integrifolia]
MNRVFGLFYFFQKLVITKAKAAVIQNVSDLYTTNIPPCLKVADLGCSSGPNTLLVITEITEALDKRCHQLNRDTPEFQVFLNDLLNNDFNIIFKTLPAFYEKPKEEKGEKFGYCSISGLPGSFYERLFPSRSSFPEATVNGYQFTVDYGKVPSMAESNKGNIYFVRMSSPSVHKSYLEQFQKDFSLFLSLRSKKIISGGQMVLTMLGRRSEDPFGNACYIWEYLSKSLNDLVSEGLTEEAKVDSFNLPFYMPSSEELDVIVSADGSFYLDELEFFYINWDGCDDDATKSSCLIDLQVGRK